MTRTATSSNCCVTAETALESALLQKTPPRQSRESDDDARFRTASERLRAQHNVAPPHAVSMVWAHGTEALHALVEHLYTYDTTGSSAVTVRSGKQAAAARLNSRCGRHNSISNDS
jgi:hypothetical protein